MAPWKECVDSSNILLRNTIRELQPQLLNAAVAHQELEQVLLQQVDTDGGASAEFNCCPLANADKVDPAYAVPLTPDCSAPASSTMFLQVPRRGQLRSMMRPIPPWLRANIQFPALKPIGLRGPSSRRIRQHLKAQPFFPLASELPSVASATHETRISAVAATVPGSAAISYGRINHI